MHGATTARVTLSLSVQDTALLIETLHVYALKRTDDAQKPGLLAAVRDQARKDAQRARKLAEDIQS